MANENQQILDSGRVEVDTSAPFESVKEAATRFGGMGFWKPVSQKPSHHVFEHESEVVDVVNLEEQAAQLERDLIVKERETLDVLKELETTKNMVEELKSSLQKEASEINAALKAESTIYAENLVKHQKHQTINQNVVSSVNLCPAEAPGFILLELKQAKLNLTKTTTDLADIRSSVNLYNKKIEKERVSLEKTRQRLSSNTSKISSLEEELNQTKQKLEQVNDNDPINITQELQKLSSETEQFRKVGEAAKSQVQQAVSEIKQTKARIRTAEIRLIAAKKLKEAARASEAVAFAEMKSLKNTHHISKDVTLTIEEYSSLISKAREADGSCKERVTDTMVLVNEANLSKTEILKKVEEARKEVKTSKKALEEALSRVETANQGKQAVEEALRVWRSEHGHTHKRRSVHNCTKFKNPSLQRKDSRLLDVSEELKPVLKPTLSIGQILSRKLLLTEEYENGVKTDKIMGKRKVSLGQMLSRPSSDQHSARKSGKENKEVSVKRKKFGFGRISLLVTKQSKKKNNVEARLMCRSYA